MLIKLDFPSSTLVVQHSTAQNSTKKAPRVVSTKIKMWKFRTIASFLISWSGSGKSLHTKASLIPSRFPLEMSRLTPDWGNLIEKKRIFKVHDLCYRGARGRRIKIHDLWDSPTRKPDSWWCFIFINKRSGQKLFSDASCRRARANNKFTRCECLFSDRVHGIWGEFRASLIYRLISMLDDENCEAGKKSPSTDAGNESETIFFPPHSTHPGPGPSWVNKFGWFFHGGMESQVKKAALTQ